jgi:hypothetical protein
MSGARRDRSFCSSVLRPFGGPSESLRGMRLWPVGVRDFILEIVCRGRAVGWPGALAGVAGRSSKPKTTEAGLCAGPECAPHVQPSIISWRGTGGTPPLSRRPPPGRPREREAFLFGFHHLGPSRMSLQDTTRSRASSGHAVHVCAAARPRALKIIWLPLSSNSRVEFSLGSYWFSTACCLYGARLKSEPRA